MATAARPLTILFAMLAETGHIAGTFRLASTLRARGHRVVYIGLADFEEIVTARGFEFVAFAADLLPKGYVDAFAASLTARRRSPTFAGPFGRARRRDDGALFAAWLARIDGGPLDDAILSRGPDLVLCDPFVWYVGLRALRLGIPTLNLRIVLNHYANPRIPPVVTSMAPAADATGVASLRIRAAWWRMRIGFLFSRRIASRLRGDFRFPTRMHHLEDVFLRVARGAGYDAAAGRTYWRGEMGPWLNLPSVVLVPRAFQFREAIGGASDSAVCYAGDVVDLDRPEEPLAIDWHSSPSPATPRPATARGADAANAMNATNATNPPPAVPLIYCSLGTSAHFYPDAARFFRTVAGLAARRPDWRIVLHVGDFAGREIEEAARSNLVVRRRVPQLALLRQAAAMVTHGGMNSILECVHFEVPMVIVPAMRDQPGNAARAAHHGIALTAAMARITAERLEALIAQARADAGIRRALAEMKHRIAAELGIAAAAEFIERHAR